MSYSPARVDSDWPYQIMLPASQCVGANYNLIRDFCDELSLSPHGHSIVKDDARHHVYCFAEREHAERFQERFSCEWFDPAHRGRGNSWMRIRPPRASNY